MRFETYTDRESLSFAAAKSIHSFVRENPTAKLCLATGGTPERTYELLVELNKNGGNVFSSARLIKLDEWGGLNAEHPATCEYYLRERLLKPLNIAAHQYISFKSDAKEPQLECERVERELDSIGPIDLCILGLGANGHLGFNEPAAQLTPSVHVAQLAAMTQNHPMVDAMSDKPKYGMTLGMANILQSRKIMMLVSGEHKRDQLRRLFEQRVDSQFPASFLWLHSDVTVYSDM
jgi:galactosamine-6-phosphate isomerase